MEATGPGVTLSPGQVQEEGTCQMSRTLIAIGPKDHSLTP